MGKSVDEGEGSFQNPAAFLLDNPIPVQINYKNID
jgi:hypothetical protein